MPDTISFARGAPCPEALSHDLIGDCVQRALKADPTRLLSYGTGEGYPPLREAIAELRGVTADQIFITNGSLQGFVFLLSTLLDTGDRVAVEAPTYDRALLQLRAHGMEVQPIAVERDGLDVAALERECAAGRVPRMLYTIPNFQNPSGATMSGDKRTALVELAERYDITILEDDPYGPLRFEGEHLPGLAEIAPPGRVLFTSSFSKTVAPGLRVGYIVTPPDLAARFATTANQTYISPAFLAQGALHQLIVAGRLDENIATVTDLMRARRDAMIGALDQMPDGTACAPPEGGFFCWMELPEGLSADALFEPARAGGVVYVKGSDCFVSGGERTLRLAFSGVSPEEISVGMERLGAVFRAAS